MIKRLHLIGPRVTNRAAIALIAMLASACTVGPNYKRLPVTMPDEFRSQSPASAVARDVSIGDERWSAVFDDEALQRLITTALAENFDLQIAASRILQAEAQLGITRADRFPTVDGQASVQGSHNSITTGERGNFSTRRIGIVGG
jgi:outer membrane protein, multidrug efflux system